MLLSGFTFIRNALKYDFPIRECIESMLPLVDELVVNVGRSDDGTEKLLATIADGSPKIRLLHSVWDDSKTDRGLVLSEQTNIALEACQGRWALYLQADEALHEAEHKAIRRAVEEADRGPAPPDGLRFRYLHFYGGYTLVQRPWNWYPSEIRLVRRASGARSHGDAQTFRLPGERELTAPLLDAHVYHYGHARAPEVMQRKIRYFHRFWHGDDHGIAVAHAYRLDLKNLVWYWGTHPAPYRTRVEAGRAWSPRPSQFAPAFRNVVISASADAEQQRVARELLELIRQYRPEVAPQVIGDGLQEWLSVQGASTALVDLAAETRGKMSMGLRATRLITGFRHRIADAPEGTLSRARCRLYSAVSWGCHQTREQGFLVPPQARAPQLGRWLGFDP